MITIKNNRFLFSSVLLCAVMLLLQIVILNSNYFFTIDANFYAVLSKVLLGLSIIFSLYSLLLTYEMIKIKKMLALPYVVQFMGAIISMLQYNEYLHRVANVHIAQEFILITYFICLFSSIILMLIFRKLKLS